MIEIQFRREQHTTLRAFHQSAKVIASTGRHIENHIWLEPGTYPRICFLLTVGKLTDDEIYDALTVEFTLPKPARFTKVTTDVSELN